MKTFSFLTILILCFSTLNGKDVDTLEVDELESYMQKNVIVIDIRKEKDWKETGVIPNSYKIPFIKTRNKSNEKRWKHTLVRLIKNKDRAFVLISYEGHEAKKLASKLQKEGKFANVKYLKGGFKSWKAAHRKVVNY